MSKPDQSITANPNFIALIDENNKPIVIYVPQEETQDVDKVLKYNTFANISLDYFDSQLFQWTSIESNYAVKSLFEVEGVSVYGMLIKPTGLKIVIGFDLSIEGNNEANTNAVFELVKKIYVRVKCNPFIDAHDKTNNETLVENLESKFDQYFTTIGSKD